MKFLLAPNSFKNCLSSVRVAEAMAGGIRAAAPESQIIKSPFSDGGDGLLEVMLQLDGARFEEAATFDPLMRPIRARWLIYKDIAIIETALACGLALLSFPEECFPLAATSYGVGVLIKGAVQKGIKKIVLGLGGSATTDGGSGMLSALGFRFLNKNGAELQQGGSSLLELADIDDEKVSPTILEAEFTILTDVINPLLGKEGTAKIFAPQKGASTEDMRILEQALTNFARVIEHKKRKNISDIAGGGAAGGIAAGAIAMLNAKIQSGAEWVAHHNGFMSYVKDVDWVITGEGKLDHQTFYGKVPNFVSRIAKLHKKKVAAFAGRVENGAKKMVHEFDYIDWIMKGDMTFEQAIKEAEKNLAELLYNFTMSTVAG
jgi:glycerate kinase